MKRFILLLTAFLPLFANAAFEDFFHAKSLRIDYFHSGNDKNDYYSIDALIEEPYWGGSRVNLTEKFNYGDYKFVLIDLIYDSVIFSYTYSTLFAEWQTTSEAKVTYRTFSETVICPFPKHNVRAEFYSRNRNGEWKKKFEYEINPYSYYISKERKKEYPLIEIYKSGEPANCVDIVILPDGYTTDEMDKFMSDCKKHAKYLFKASPFKENKKKFNIWAIKAPSEESGTDSPGDNIWKKTILNTSFYTLGTERYLMSTDNKSIRDVASNAPYDQIFILINSSHYGGGAIYNFYATCISDNPMGEYIFTHEFGHSFAGLGDEYYDSETSYIDFYPLDLEPWEPNLTTLVDFGSKWKNMVEEGTPTPTPNEETYKDEVGVFEGGGYVNRGVYRPYYDCTMKSISTDNFCPVCKSAIQKMIDFYTE